MLARLQHVDLQILDLVLPDLLHCDVDLISHLDLHFLRLGLLW